MFSLSLPVFGEGGRAKRGRVGTTKGMVVPGKEPHPTLPEDGEGSNYRHYSTNRVATTCSYGISPLRIPIERAKAFMPATNSGVIFAS